MTSTGLVLGLALLALYGFCFLKPEQSRSRARTLARDYNAGIYTMAIGMVWFWLLVAPAGSFLGKLAMPLGEFSGLKPYLQIGVPLACLGMILYVREFLFVRGLGLCFLMAAAPILYSAFLKEPDSRVILSSVAYLMIIKGLFYVSMPYLFRDAMNWATEKVGRWKALSVSGLAVAFTILICAVTVWRGH